jgi:hypothetical protein
MDAFTQSVEKHFGFLSKQYGFARAELDPRAVEFHSPKVRIAIGCDRGSFSLSIATGGVEPTIRRGRGYYCFDLSCFAVDRGGEDSEYNCHSYPSDGELMLHLDNEMADAAAALRQYAPDVLDGTFSDWEGMSSRMTARWKQSQTRNST